eukprot:SAG31_NODE_1198_length_9441_cov_3.648897_4_plen_158_part_00
MRVQCPTRVHSTPSNHIVLQLHPRATGHDHSIRLLRAERGGAPPTRSFFSSRVTAYPARRSLPATANPAIPPPTTTAVGAADAMVTLAGRPAPKCIVLDPPAAAGCLDRSVRIADGTSGPKRRIRHTIRHTATIATNLDLNLVRRYRTYIVLNFSRT